MEQVTPIVTAQRWKCFGLHKNSIPYSHQTTTFRSAIGICTFVEATDNAVFDDNHILLKRKENSTRAGKENIRVYRYLRVAALASGSASEIPFRIASSISLTRLMKENI